MAKVQTLLKLYGVLLLVAALSSFTVMASDDSSKSAEHSAEKDSPTDDDTNNDHDEHSSEKRSREEIFSGNQQNMPSGLVDDLMSMSENDEDDIIRSKKNQGQEDTNEDLVSKEQTEEKRTPVTEEDRNDMLASSPDNWYNTVPVSSATLQYLANTPTLQSLPPQSYANSLYDQEDVYRRKRQLLPRPLPLRRRRSLRNSLGEMIQQRGLRMPRRAMRLKRQVDLYSLLGNDAFYDDQTQVPTSNFNGRENRMSKRHVPGRFSPYPETPAIEFTRPRYPYAFQHRGESILGDDLEDNREEDGEEGLTLDDIDNLMLMHPNSRYVQEPPEYPVLPYRTRDEENEAFQKWLSRHTVPSPIRVSRRSPRTFYPIDYRYIPFTKRNVFSHGNRMSNHFTEDQNDEPELGKWGHVVQVPEAYASPEDVAKLYGLASLMAEGDDEVNVKRAT